MTQTIKEARQAHHERKGGLTTRGEPACMRDGQIQGTQEASRSGTNVRNGRELSRPRNRKLVHIIELSRNKQGVLTSQRFPAFANNTQIPAQLSMTGTTLEHPGTSSPTSRMARHAPCYKYPGVTRPFENQHETDCYVSGPSALEYWVPLLPSAVRK